MESTLTRTPLPLSSVLLYDVPYRWWLKREPGGTRVWPHVREATLLRLLEVGRAGDAVYAHPERVDYWLVLPPYVTLITYPDGQEVTKRLEPRRWAHKLSGIPSQYRTSAPSERSRYRVPWYEAEALIARVEEAKASTVAATPTGGEPIPWDLLEAATDIALDTETDVKKGDKVRPTHDPVLGVSLAGKDWDCWIAAADVQANLARLQAVLGAKRLIGHNAKFDTITTRRLGLTLDFADDTMLMAYVAGGRYPVGLKALVRLLRGRYAQELGPLIDRYGSVGAIPHETLHTYARADARNTWDVDEDMHLVRGGIDPLYYELELPISKLLTEMEWNGWRVDNERLHALDLELTTYTETMEAAIRDEWGFGPREKKALWELLRDAGYHLPATKNGYSVAEDVLEKIDHPIIEPILDYREAHKQKTVWVRAMVELQDERGYLHPSWNQIPVSGRLSCSNPNMQNYPLKIRACLLPDPGHVLVAADCSQFELRIMAAQSLDPVMLDEFRRGVDIHEANRLLLGLADRGTAKRLVSFGVSYGMDAVKLSEETGYPIFACREFIATIFRKYAGLKEYIQRVKREARDTQYGYTMMRRPRWVPEINFDDRTLRGHAERAIVNHTIQGTGGDLIKLGQLELETYLQRHGARQLGQNHDEFIVSTPDPFKTYEGLMHVSEIFSEWLDPVPFHLDIMVGPRWGMKGGI